MSILLQNFDRKLKNLVKRPKFLNTELKNVEKVNVATN